MRSEEGRRRKGAALEATVHRKSLLLRVQVQRASASGVGVVVVVALWTTEGDEREPLSGGRERGGGRLLRSAVIARLDELRLLEGLAGTRLSELKFHLGHALGSKLELSLHVLHDRSVVAVRGSGAASGWRVSEWVGVLGGHVVRERYAAAVLGVLLLVELGHEFA